MAASAPAAARVKSFTFIAILPLRTRAATASKAASPRQGPSGAEKGRAGAGGARSLRLFEAHKTRGVPPRRLPPPVPPPPVALPAAAAPAAITTGQVAPDFTTSGALAGNPFT